MYYISQFHHPEDAAARRVFAMFLAGMFGHLKANASAAGWRDKERRSLREAAILACRLAEAEELAIGAVLQPDRRAAWHAKSLLAAVPVYGRRDKADQLTPIDAFTRQRLELDDSGEHLGRGEDAWHDLQVTREDFGRYVDWLRSVR